MKALITGAGSGLGRSLYEALYQLGYELIAVGRTAEDLKTLPGNPECLCLDLQDPHSRRILLNRIKQNPPDLLINNAGCGFYGDFISLPLEEHLSVFELNSQAVLEILYTTAKALKEHKKQGVIVTISSALAFFPCPSFATYSASKAFVTHLSCALDTELKGQGIRILTSCPGQIATSFRDKAAKKTVSENRPWLTLTPKRAAKLILRQIHKRKVCQIIDWRYRWLLKLTYFLPKTWVMKSLRKAILSRTHTG